VNKTDVDVIGRRLIAAHQTGTTRQVQQH